MPSYPATAVNQISLMTFRSTLNGQLVLNTFKYRITIVGTDPTWDVAATNFVNDVKKANALMTKFLNVSPNNLSLVEIWMQLIFPQRYRKMVFVVNQGGAQVSVAGAANLAATITRTGIIANKHNTGSLHLAYANSDGTMSGGFVGPNMLTNMGLLGSEMLNVRVPATGLTTWEPGLFPAKATSVQQWVPLYQTIPQTTVRVMRRRTVGVGK